MHVPHNAEHIAGRHGISAKEFVSIAALDKQDDVRVLLLDCKPLLLERRVLDARAALDARKGRFV